LGLGIRAAPSNAKRAKILEHGGPRALRALVEVSRGAVGWKMTTNRCGSLSGG
jgi:hypothetical protein